MIRELASLAAGGLIGRYVARGIRALESRIAPQVTTKPFYARPDWWIRLVLSGVSIYASTKVRHDIVRLGLIGAGTVMAVDAVDTVIAEELTRRGVPVGPALFLP